MNLLRLSPAFALVTVLSSPGVRAQDGAGDAGPLLKGRHELSLHLGTLNWSSVEADVSPGSIEADTRVNGFLGSVNYAYWLEEDVAITFAVGGTGVGLSANISAGSVRSETDAVGFVLVGASYYPPAVTFRPNVLGFVSGAAGTYIGEATNTSTAPGSVVVENVSERAFGARFAVGVDWFAANRLVVGGNLGYHVMADFDRAIGGAENYSGPELSVSVGVIIGRAQRPGN